MGVAVPTKNYESMTPWVSVVENRNGGFWLHQRFPENGRLPNP